jgi:hypothetical protein
MALRHQLNVLRRRSPKRLAFSISIVWLLPASIGLQVGCSTYCFKFSRDHRSTQHIGAPQCAALFVGS